MCLVIVGHAMIRDYHIRVHWMMAAQAQKPLVSSLPRHVQVQHIEIACPMRPGAIAVHGSMAADCIGEYTAAA